MTARCVSKKSIIEILLITALILVADTGRAQYPEDALRFATPGLGVGARSMGMGNAYTGVANDFSAIYWNPAGLAQAQYGEFSFGLSQLNFRDESDFFDTKQSYNNNSTNLNSLGLVFPVDVTRGSLVFAFGFARQSNFTTGMSFTGFNPLSSIIQTYAPDGALAPSSPSGNLAWELYLANIDTVTGRWISPIRDRLTQLGTVLEGGGLNNWSAAGAVDIAKNLSVGVTLTFISGSYKFDRNYTERDTRNLYTTLPFDFDQVTIADNVESDLSGFGAKIGLLYRSEKHFRLGIAVKTPTTIRSKEDFSTSATSYFDNGDILPANGPFQSSGSNEYDVITPWVFSAGASVVLRDLILSGDVDYTDWTQLEFSDAPQALIALNQEIKTIFRPTANARFGAEYDISDIGLRLRGGFIYNTSPFDGDPSTFDQKYVTGGLGIPLGEASMLDLAYARGWWDTYRVNYDATSRVDESVATNNFLMTFSYRF